jgi:peptidyl-prolyl cis-trans isomerase A (cyclophilin A)
MTIMLTAFITICFLSILGISRAFQAQSFDKTYHRTSLVSLKSTVDSEDESTSVLSRRHALSKYLIIGHAVGSSLLIHPTYSSFAETTEETKTGRLIQFTVKNLSDGSSGQFTVQTFPNWAPKGVARFEELVSLRFFDDCKAFRVLPGFIVQFGINGTPSIQEKWRSNSIADDVVRQTNARGTLTFATSGPNSRTTQIFINTGDNTFLDRQGFAPIGKVVQGMDVVDRFYAGYGEGAPSGKGPSQGMIQFRGNEYLDKAYPNLTYFSHVDFLE